MAAGSSANNSISSYPTLGNLKCQLPNFLIKKRRSFLIIFSIIIEYNLTVRQIWFNFLVFFAILLTSVFIHKDSFNLNYPGLIDDGSDIVQIKENNYFNLIKLSFSEERTRPVRLIIRKILYDKYDGKDFYVYHIINAITVAVLVFLVYLILSISTKKKILSVLFSLSIFLLPELYANSIRLGTDEIYQIIFLLLLVISLYYKKYWFSFLFFLLNIFIKESGIFYILIPFFYFFDDFFKKKKSIFEAIKKLLPYTIVCLFLAVTMILKMLFLKENNYITRSVTLEQIYQNILINRPIIISVLLIVILDLCFFRKEKIEKILNILVISSIFIYLIWNCNQDYYYLPTMVFGCISFSNILIGLLKNKISKILISILFIIIGYKFYINVTSRSINDYIKYERKLTSLTPFLIENDFSSYLVYLNLGGFETNDKARIYLTEWNKLNKSAPVIISANYYDQINNLFLKENSNKKILISYFENPYLNNSFYKKTIGDNFFYIYFVKE